MENYQQFRPEKFEYNLGWIKNWFSNMEPIKLLMDGIVYNSAENYYQAMKSKHRGDHLWIAKMTPKQSRKAGKLLREIRSDWKEVKEKIMYDILLIKFQLEPYKTKLLETNNDMIIEWNNWNDKE